MKKFLVIFIFLPLWAQSLQQPLPAQEAFRLAVEIKPAKLIVATWHIAPGYHLFHDAISFKPLSATHTQLGQPTFSTGKKIKQRLVYEHGLTVKIPIEKHLGSDLRLQVKYQGCSDSGLCYAPVSQTLTLNASQPSATLYQTPYAVTDPTRKLLDQTNLFWLLAGFFGLGLLLALTPCVLPMIPILSSLIVGYGKEITATKAGCLSFIYVLSMASTYAIAGVVTALAGQHLQALLQTPWTIGAFSLVFILLAFALFGFYELQLPAALQNRLHKLNRHQSHGSYLGAAIMGCVATLLASPCVSAPLVGILGYIGTTGNVGLGGSALFALGLGMGVPLLIAGTFGGSLLPKTGIWMEKIKHLFGVIMLAMAIWMLARILPATLISALWGIFWIFCAIYLGALEPASSNARKFWKACGIILLIYGALLFVLAIQAYQASTPSSTTSNVQTTHAKWQTIHNLSELNQALSIAQKRQQLVLLDFYADWCTTCKQLDQQLFANRELQPLLKHFVLLRVDVTKPDAAIKTLSQHFKVVGPPTVLFFNTAGIEQVEKRLTGDITASSFRQHLMSLSKE